MICLAAGTLAASLAVADITLAWTHSIERIRWEEDWRLEAGRLVAVEARVRGSGAGMEIPAGAALASGVWRYRPALPPLRELRLARSDFVADYVLCVNGDCRPLAGWLPGVDNAAEVVVAPCPP